MKLSQYISSKIDFVKKPYKSYKKSVHRQPKRGNDISANRRIKLFTRNLKSKEKKKFKNRLKSFYQSRKYSGFVKKKKMPSHFIPRIKYEANVELFCNSNPNKKYKQYRGSLALANDFCLHQNLDKVLTTPLRILNNAKQQNNYTMVECTHNVSFGAIYLLDSAC